MHDVAGEAVLTELIEVAPVGIALIDQSMRFIWVNDAMCELLGYSRAEFLEMQVTDISHPENLNEDVRERFITGEMSRVTLEKRQLTKGGDAKWVRVNACVFKTGSKDSEYGALFVEDISDRVRAQRELAARSSDAMQKLSRLTVREKEVLELAADGKTFAEIAEVLYLSKRTVESHAAAAYRKLGVTGRDEAISTLKHLQKLIELPAAPFADVTASSASGART